MKSRKPLLALLAAGSMTLAGSLLAQDQGMQTPPPPPPAPATPMPATPPTPPPAPRSTMPATTATHAAPTAIMPATTPTPPPPAGTQANVNSPQGQVTINSSVPPVHTGPAPSFEQLSGGARFITEDQAAAYPLLANDFLYVDKGHTGHITKAQYERWLNNK